MQSSSKVLAGVVIVAVIVLFVYWFETPSSATPSTTTATTTETTDTNSTTTANTARNYKDGTYTTTSGYISPGGKDSLGVTITLSGGKISAVTVKNMANDGTSKSYQNRFIGAIQTAVVGKFISDLKIGVVSGASLTTNAFNSALNQIRIQATN